MFRFIYLLIGKKLFLRYIVKFYCKIEDNNCNRDHVIQVFVFLYVFYLNKVGTLIVLHLFQVSEEFFATRILAFLGQTIEGKYPKMVNF